MFSNKRHKGKGPSWKRTYWGTMRMEVEETVFRLYRIRKKSTVKWRGRIILKKRRKIFRQVSPILSILYSILILLYFFSFLLIKISESQKSCVKKFFIYLFKIKCNMVVRRYYLFFLQWKLDHKNGLGSTSFDPSIWERDQQTIRLWAFMTP